MMKPCYLNKNSFKVPGKKKKDKPIAKLIFGQITIRFHIKFNIKKEEKSNGPKNMNYENEGSLSMLKNQQFSLTQIKLNTFE